MKTKFMRTSLLMLILVLMLSMVACGGGDSKGDSEGDSSANSESTALEVYNAASKKLTDAESYSASSDIAMKLKAQGESMDTTATSDMKQVKTGDNKVEMEMITKTNVMGQNIESKGYYQDGFYYMDTNGQKMKMEMSFNDVLKQSNSGTLTLTKDMVKEQSVKDKDGGQEITMVLDGQKVMDAGMGAMQNMDQLAGAAEDMKIGSMDIKAFIDGSGNIKNTNITFAMDMTASGQEMSIDVDITMDITKIGGITVKLPTDLNTYVETDPSTIQ